MTDAGLTWPDVSVILATRNRPQLLARAVDAVLAQDYPGPLSVTVVIDQRTPELDLPDFADPRVTVIDNGRTPGLAGARNSGILASDGEWLAFCDDDDIWKQGKLTAQLTALRTAPDAVVSSTAIEVDFDGTTNDRLAGTERVTHEQLLASRMSMVHSSTLVLRRTALLGPLGLVSEDVPGSINEDWDLLLRASKLAPVVNVDRPLVTVAWSAASYFSRDWSTIIASLTWMLAHHPDIATSPTGSARVYGQLAFATAASHHRRAALRWATRSCRNNWREPRAYLALAVILGVPAGTILNTLHKRGRGI